VNAFFPYFPYQLSAGADIIVPNYCQLSAGAEGEYGKDDVIHRSTLTMNLSWEDETRSNFSLVELLFW